MFVCFMSNLRGDGLAHAIRAREFDAAINCQHREQIQFTPVNRGHYWVSSARRILPVGLVGNSSRNSKTLGILKSAILPRQNSASSTSVQGPRRTMTALTFSSPYDVATPTTATLSTPGCSSKTLSTSRGSILKPLLLIKNFKRPCKYNRPCSSKRPRSPVKKEPSRKTCAFNSGKPA